MPRNPHWYMLRREWSDVGDSVFQEVVAAIRVQASPRCLTSTRIASSASAAGAIGPFPGARRVSESVATSVMRGTTPKRFPIGVNCFTPRTIRVQVVAVIVAMRGTATINGPGMMPGPFIVIQAAW